MLSNEGLADSHPHSHIHKLTHCPVVLTRTQVQCLHHREAHDFLCAGQRSPYDIWPVDLRAITPFSRSSKPRFPGKLE